ncbi:MAG: TetR/AcrR family transcriptional regulator [Nocardioidaceae bacterium]
MAQRPATGSEVRPEKVSAARSRILAAADRLFYGKGIRAVGVDRVVAEAQVTRVTFYRHFPTKDHLISAYLDGRLHRDKDQLADLRRRHPGDPRAVLTGLAQALAQETTASGFRGCAYANLTAEYCDAGHPARSIAGQHRSWLLGQVQQLLTDLGSPKPDLVAEQLVMLRAGAMAVSSVGRSDNVAMAFTDAWTALIGPAD